MKFSWFGALIRPLAHFWRILQKALKSTDIDLIFGKNGINQSESRHFGARAVDKNDGDNGGGFGSDCGKLVYNNTVKLLYPFFFPYRLLF